MNRYGRAGFALAALVMNACSSDATIPRMRNELDAATNVAVTSSERASEPSRDVPDASPMTSDGGGSTTPVNTSSEPTWTTPADSGAETSPELDVADASSPIEEPVVSQLTWGELCTAVGQLEGRVVEVELTNQVLRGSWLTSNVPLEEAGVLPDAGRESACGERFAPYVAPCNGSVVVIQSPELVFGEGPNLGGEAMSVGCWESACERTCLPEGANAFERVRARVGGVINLAFDPTLDIYVGETRINGFDVSGVAVLEVLELLE